MGNHLSTSIEFTIVYNKNEAQALLNEAEKKDFYLEECNEDPLNANARKHTSYAANVMTDREYKFFEVVVGNAKNRIPLRLEQDLKSVYLIQLMPSADGGMPHTRPGHIICYPDITQTFSFHTLIHELWHVHQRIYLAEWTDVFRQQGWEQWTGTLPASLESKRRFNPDTIDMPLWCYQKMWVPVPIFRDISKPKVTEVDIWFYHVPLKYHVRSIPKEMVLVYTNLPLSAYEHPREIAAYLLSDPGKYVECPAFHQLVEIMGAMALPRD